jgi:hypothetical protein
MKSAVAGLIVALVLFVTWLAYLAYLVYTTKTPSGQPPVVLSRPQFLISTLDVVADVPDQTGPVTVEQVLYPPEGAPVKAGDKITVENLSACREWTGPGRYLLALEAAEDDKMHYRVAPTPPSPGYPPGRQGAGPPRLYPADPQALAQYRDILPHKPH